MDEKKLPTDLDRAIAVRVCELMSKHTHRSMSSVCEPMNVKVHTDDPFAPSEMARQALWEYRACTGEWDWIAAANMLARGWYPDVGKLHGSKGQK